MNEAYSIRSRIESFPLLASLNTLIAPSLSNSRLAFESPNNSLCNRVTKVTPINRTVMPIKLRSESSATRSVISSPQYDYAINKISDSPAPTTISDLNTASAASDHVNRVISASPNTEKIRANVLICSSH